MNYQLHYDKLIERAKNRSLSCYLEKHHIIPRCLGGSNDKENLVDLTPEEHYIAHQLLVKINPDNKKLLNAAIMMIPKRPSNKLYGWLRKRFAEHRSITQSGDKNTQFGTKWIYNDELKQNKKIKKDSSIPGGWKEGRKINFNTEIFYCKFCKNEFKRIKLEFYCSDDCKKNHLKSDAIKIIDDNLDELLNFYLEARSIDKTLKHFGVVGARAGNKYFSSILKKKNIYVRPSSKKARLAQEGEQLPSKQ
jgi:hypothetical protein